MYDTDRFLDIKLSCREQMLQKLMDYDLAKGAEYATYIFPFIRDAMLRFRMGEEKWSVSSLTNYKMVRSMAWLYHNTKDAVNEFSKKYNCDLALAEEYLKVVRGIRNQQPFYVTDEDGEETGEDVALDDSWNYLYGASSQCFVSLFPIEQPRTNEYLLIKMTQSELDLSSSSALRLSVWLVQ